MCGIAGVLDVYSPAAVIREQLTYLCQQLSHRGPDAHGIQSFPNGGFSHTRLSIIDLSDAGRQPMTSEDGRIHMVFNGEIYNFALLKSELQDQGYRFRSGTDSEVLLNAFHAWGVNAFPKLNGMFAAAFFDAKHKKLTLVRDQFGIKPLHVAQTATGVYFASEIKALLKFITPAGLNHQALSEFMYYGNALGERTFYQSITRILPGEYWEISTDTHKMTKKRFWQPQLPVRTMGTNKKSAINEAISKTRRLLRLGVHRQLVSDVPVGVFLSGGVDSSAITALASEQLGSALNTYSVGFDFAGGVNELPQAARVAKKFGTNHHEIHISGYDLADTVTELSQAFDEPFGDAANIPLYLLCKAVKGDVKVVLQGDGGDEIFAGYRRYSTFRWANVARLPASFLTPAIARLPDSSRKNRVHRYLQALAAKDPAMRMARLLTVDFPESECAPPQVLSRELQQQLIHNDPFARYKEVAEQYTGLDSVQQMLFTDMSIILPDIFLEKVDRATMAASLEVRVPFLDQDLVDYVVALPRKIKMLGGQKKGLLRSALRGVVPDEVLDAPKTGFGVPYGHWLKGPLRDMTHEAILGSHATGWFNRPVAEKLLKQHESGERNWDFLLWKSMQLGLWLSRSPNGEMA